MADRTPNELAGVDDLADPSADWTVPNLLAAIESAMSDGEYDTSYLLVPAARLLRRQGEQLDTLRAERDRLLEAIGDTDLPRMATRHADSCTVCSYPLDCDVADLLDRLAAAVPQDPEEGRA